MKKTLSKYSILFLCILYAVAWGILVAWFWLGLDPGDGLGYSVVSFFVVLPVCSFFPSLLCGRRAVPLPWLAPVLFGCMAMLADFVTFRLASSLSTWHINAPNMGLACVSAIPAAVGLMIGRSMRKRPLTP